MQNDLLIALLAGLGGMLGWGFADFFAKKTIDRIGPLVSLVWAHVFGTIAILIFALFQIFVLNNSVPLPTGGTNIEGLAFFGALQALVYLLVYIGFGKGQVAVLNPIFASYGGIAAFVSIIFLGETANLNKTLSIGVIFIGILLLSLDISALRSKKLNVIPGLREVGLASILAAFWTLSWDKFIGGQNYISFALFMYAFMTLTAFIIAKSQKTNLKDVRKDVWKFLILIGLGEIVAYLSISYGFSRTNLTSVVAIVSGSFSLPTIILAHLFLKERFTKYQAFGAAALISGIVAISIAK